GWMYGYGLDWAGRIVERVTGNTLEEHIHKRMLEPLGLKPDAKFLPLTREDLRERAVDLNPDDPEGLGLAVMGQWADINTRTDGCFGGQGLAMSATSYIKIMQSLLANDGKLLKPETVDDMFQQHLSPEALHGQQDILASPLGPFYSAGIGGETKLGHGLGGVITLEDVDGWYGAHTMSWGGGLTLAWFIDRKTDICGIGAILAKLPLDWEVSTDLKDVFRKDVYQIYAVWRKEGKI
ncbi:beta-lactamase, partial [Fusarium beomiforme]